ncbi:unnamed protein product, partial [marine sediment metagenome]
DKDGQPGPELRYYPSSEDGFRGEYFAQESSDETGRRRTKTYHNGGLHRLWVAADQDWQANHKHHKVDDGIGDSEVLLAVKLSEVFDFCFLGCECGQLSGTEQRFMF